MTDTTEIRAYQVELRETQAVGRPFKYIEGRAVPYNTWQDVGPFMENHGEGSFERSTSGGTGRAAPLLIEHGQRDIDNLIGHAESWRHDGTGLYGVWKLNDQPRAQQAGQLAANGDLSGLSVSFQEVHANKTRHDGRVWVARSESRLLEVSLTTMPAFPTAGVVMVRSVFDPDTLAETPIPTPDLDAWRARLAGLRR